MIYDTYERTIQAVISRNRDETSTFSISTVSFPAESRTSEFPNSNDNYTVKFSASVPKEGTSKKRPSPHLHIDPTGSNKVIPRTFQTSLILIRWALEI